MSIIRVGARTAQTQNRTRPNCTTLTSSRRLGDLGLGHLLEGVLADQRAILACRAARVQLAFQVGRVLVPQAKNVLVHRVVVVRGDGTNLAQEARTIRGSSHNRAEGRAICTG